MSLYMYMYLHHDSSQNLNKQLTRIAILTHVGRRRKGLVTLINIIIVVSQQKI